MCQDGPFASVGCMLAAYILRGSVTNSASGVAKSLIVDIVAERYRAKWNAVESLKSRRGLGARSWVATSRTGWDIVRRLPSKAGLHFTYDALQARHLRPHQRTLRNSDRTGSRDRSCSCVTLVRVDPRATPFEADLFV